MRQPNAERARALRNLIGEVLDSKYRIERQLGEGGMGAVYFATHLGTERPVAVKVIAPQFMKHDEFVERFRREARAAGRLRHPNVVDVTDFGFAIVNGDEVAYLVMEYLDGCTLDEILAEESSLPLSWVIDILEQTCSAVGEAHQQGIIHRDLKPDNIWLEPNRRGGYTVKVLDFGIAKLDDPGVPASLGVTSVSPPKQFDSFAPTQPSEWQTLDLAPPITQTKIELSEAATRIQTASGDGDESSEAGTRILAGQGLEEAGTRILEDRTTDEMLGVQTGSIGSLTRVGSILGTPLYMSPEQCRGDALDTRTDIYSLGVLAYRLLSGETPFTGDVRTVMMSHREAEPPPLVVKRVPKKVAAVVMSALAKNPADRPVSAEAFATAMRAYSDGAGSLLRRSLTLYAEHLPTFLRLAVMLYAPVVVITFLLTATTYAAKHGIIPNPWGNIASAVVSFLNVLATFFAASVMIGVTTWLVTHALATPLRPMVLRPAFIAMKKRLRPFMLTTMVTSLLAFTGLFLCLVPGVYLMMRFALVAPSVMMENLTGRAAMKRSRVLVRRSIRTVLPIVFVHICVPVLVSITIALIIAAVAKAVDTEGMKAIVSIVSLSQPIVALPFTILIGSLMSVVTALMYWKLRLAGGETMSDAFTQFEEIEAPASRWQQRMRPRLQTPTKTVR